MLPLPVSSLGRRRPRSGRGSFLGGRDDNFFLLALALDDRDGSARRPLAGLRRSEPGGFQRNEKSPVAAAPPRGRMRSRPQAADTASGKSTAAFWGCLPKRRRGSAARSRRWTWPVVPGRRRLAPASAADTPASRAGTLGPRRLAPCRARPRSPGSSRCRSRGFPPTACRPTTSSSRPSWLPPSRRGGPKGR